ncbi:XRE family transcriptional regulator [Bacillus mobilis]|uniref:XRE family transcriptional regulator n=1 Tax=Bacillus mobilis TaxID=2026190 RepID=UPI003624C4F5
MVAATTVKVVRAFLDINQSELAKRMNISTSLVSVIEKRSKRITHNFIKRFKRAVGIGDTISIDIAYIQSK